MLIFDKIKIGNNLLFFRKKAGLTQAEVAEKAGLADRTYADIERGEANMRIETFMRICEALRVTPNDVLTEEGSSVTEEEILEQIRLHTPKERQTALDLLAVYFKSL